MLSILIPVYAYDVEALVHTLHQQASKLSQAWEIRLLDDASPTQWQVKNRRLAQLSGVHYQELPENVGRAKIRNLLCQQARYEYLLFLDSDSGVDHPHFLANYLAQLTPNRVLCGGRSYLPQPPKAPFYLHWWYGTQREVRPASIRRQHPYAGFMTNNFVVSKEVMLSIPFDETVTTYGHEDTLFGFQLQAAGIDIQHLDNPVLHIGLDEAANWLNKQRIAIQNLYRLHRQNPALQTQALLWWLRLHRTGLLKLALPFFKNKSPQWEQQLLHQHQPNLRVLDLLKICWLEEVHRSQQRPFLK
jgi:glycosyltransferase involved in cell wall biosynthesis